MMQVLDIEVYPNWNLFAFKDLDTKEITTFETWDTYSNKEIKKIRKLLRSTTNITFNGLGFDMPLVEYALNGADVLMMYHMCQSIINTRTNAYMIYKQMGIEQDTTIDHIDIKEPSPAVMVGLKLYGSRMGSHSLQDLPYDPHKKLSEKKAEKVKSYCKNDLQLTEDLYYAIKDRIDLRVEMSKQYGVDLRSKSDAQIAETVIVKRLDYTDKVPKLNANYTCKYVAPKYIKFKTPQLQKLLNLTETLDYTLDAGGGVVVPPEFEVFTIGSTQYKMGIGGLHSQEKSLTCTENMNNADFSSYYPFIILKNGYAPKHLGNKFLKVYDEIVQERLRAKAAGDKLIAGSLKIVINGSFGKFGSKYSKLYSPDLMLQVTITGQLTLLMIIERFEAKGIKVISSNTDGLEYSTTKIKKATKIIRKIEKITGYEMELGTYFGLHARDVNNYVANYGKYTKAKGVYCDPLDPDNFLRKNTQTPICFEAVRNFILNGTPLKKTIDDCKDIKKFLSATQVNGGAYFGKPVYGERQKVETTSKTGFKWVTPFLGFDDESYYLGKVVRWYYSTKGRGIFRKGTGNKVPLTDGVQPMMTLQESLPLDLDYKYYYEYAERMLKDLG